MIDHPISRYPVPETAELPEDLRDVILDVQEKTGFVPNVFLALAHRPDELRAFQLPARPRPAGCGRSPRPASGSVCSPRIRS